MTHFINKNSGKALAIEDMAAAMGKKVIQYDYDNTQNFDIVQRDSTHCTIEYQNIVLLRGTPGYVTTGMYHKPYDNQLWKIVPTGDKEGTFKIVSALDNRVMTVARNMPYQNGAWIEALDDDGEDDQKWYCINPK